MKLAYTDSLALLFTSLFRRSASHLEFELVVLVDEECPGASRFDSGRFLSRLPLLAALGASRFQR